MKVEVAPRATLLELKAQTVDIPPARRASCLGRDRPARAGRHPRRGPAVGGAGARRERRARDALKLSQRIVPAVPLTVQQATLVQLDGP
jgi:hypothetical protein